MNTEEYTKLLRQLEEARRFNEHPKRQREFNYNAELLRQLEEARRFNEYLKQQREFTYNAEPLPQSLLPEKPPRSTVMDRFLPALILAAILLVLFLIGGVGITKLCTEDKTTTNWEKVGE